MNAADAFDRQRSDVIDVPLHDPFEAVTQTENVDACSRARIVAAAMTLLRPGAGPPRTE
jgi:hypothetical protein